MAENIVLPHKLTLQERKQLTLSGVTEVLSFDETAVLLQTGTGTLEIQGQDLKLRQLSPEGTVSCDGKIDALIYGELRTRAGFWRRLFP